MKRNKFRKSKIRVNGGDIEVITSSSHPIHAFKKTDILYGGFRLYKGYKKFKDGYKYVGFYFLDIFNNKNRLFGTFKPKTFHKLELPSNMSEKQWINLIFK